MMKKVYVKPQMQVVKINQSANLLNNNSYATYTSGNVFNEQQISGWGGQGRSRECDWDDEE